MWESMGAWWPKFPNWFISTANGAWQVMAEHRDITSWLWPWETHNDFATAKWELMTLWPWNDLGNYSVPLWMATVIFDIWFSVYMTVLLCLMTQKVSMYSNSNSTTVSIVSSLKGIIYFIPWYHRQLYCASLLHEYVFKYFPWTCHLLNIPLSTSRMNI